MPRTLLDEVNRPVKYEQSDLAKRRAVLRDKVDKVILNEPVRDLYTKLANINIHTIDEALVESLKLTDPLDASVLPKTVV